MGGPGRGLDRSGGTVGGVRRSPPRLVRSPPGLQQPSRGPSHTPRCPDRWAEAREGIGGSARGCAAGRQRGAWGARRLGDSARRAACAGA